MTDQTAIRRAADRPGPGTDLEARAQTAALRSRALRKDSRGARLRAIRQRHRSRTVLRAFVGGVQCADTSSTPLRILVVDDVDAVRTSFAEVLRTAGFEVIEAADGFKAMEAMELLQFDAVVLDLAMAHLDGLGMLDRLDRADRTPVVIVTASDYEPAVLAHGERIFGVMTKPVEPPALISLVGEAATSGRANQP